MLRKLLIVPACSLLALSGAALAQTTDHNPAVKDNSVHHTATPAEGANSFTEAQARDRIGKAGFTNVSTLTKGDDGTWMGTAIKGGKTVKVALDYKGNVSTR